MKVTFSGYRLLCFAINYEIKKIIKKNLKMLVDRWGENLSSSNKNDKTKPKNHSITREIHYTIAIREVTKERNNHSRCHNECDIRVLPLLPTDRKCYLALF